MSSILNKEEGVPKKTTSSNGLVQRYFDFCDNQAEYRIAWFLFPALILPCFFMPAALYFLMVNSLMGSTYFLFISISMLLFMGGMVASVGGSSTRVTITFFFLAVIWNILFPIIAISLS